MCAILYLTKQYYTTLCNAMLLYADQVVWNGFSLTCHKLKTKTITENQTVQNMGEGVVQPCRAHLISQPHLRLRYLQYTVHYIKCIYINRIKLYEP